ncbi:MAG: alpha/beta hydrolase [Bacteroidetes bacterium]|nr:alpha/beta hydrolase [Bacteroidota bacterium]MBS1932714.1 alpha/beta hydrolase [Bacteroidota bacterium]
MRKKYTALFGILFFACNFSFAQSTIKYGSNNGKYISLLNTKIYYEEYGTGAPLMMLHGGLGNIADFSLCIPELSKYFHLIIPDAPGLAKSQMADSMSYELLARYASAMIDKLNLDSVYVVGWSDGGITGLILAAMRPDKVKKVLASGANYALGGYSFNDASALKPIPDDYKPSQDQQQWIDENFEANKMQWKKIVNDRIKMWSQEIYFSPKILEMINIPVTLVIGDHDAVKLEHALEMHRLVKGSYFCVLPNTSHAVFSEKPGIIDRIAIDFFEKK